MWNSLDRVLFIEHHEPMKYVLLFMFLHSQLSWAGDFRARAREHFDIHEIDRGGLSETYRGLSNTINLWYEKPFEISYGLALNPLIGSATQDNTTLLELGGRIRLIHIGGELKYFFLSQGLFTRVGGGWTQLRSDGPLE